MHRINLRILICKALYDTLISINHRSLAQTRIDRSPCITKVTLYKFRINNYYIGSKLTHVYMKQALFDYVLIGRR